MKNNESANGRNGRIGRRGGAGARLERAVLAFLLSAPLLTPSIALSQPSAPADPSLPRTQAQADSAPAALRTLPLLTPQEAVRLGVENNYSMLIARDQSEVAANNRKGGIGPFLPEFRASASHGGLAIGSNPNTTLGVSGALQIFDGFQSYHGYQRLKAQEAGARLEERQALETTVEAILSGYYAIAQEKLRLEAIRELLAVSQERAKLAQARMEVGAGSRLEQLQSLSDLNADSASFMSRQTALQEAKMRLNRLLARNPAETFDVLDTIPLETGLPVEAWRTGLAENNSAIRLARTGKKAAALGVEEARGSYLPDVNAGIQYNTDAAALVDEEGFLREEGLTYSLNLSVPIFDGLRTRTSVANARLGLRQAETRIRQQETEVAGEFDQAQARHASGTRQVALEERNLEVSRLQAEAARERYRLGASSPLEMRDAQTRLLDSRSRLATARQETKIAELALKRLAGDLVKEVPPDSGAPAGGPAGGSNGGTR